MLTNIRSSTMRELIRQINQALKANLFYLSLYATLTIPDILAAIESKNGRASGKKYKKWFDKYVAHKYESPHTSGTPVLTGEDVYKLRCSLLHQGKSEPNTKYSKIIFVEPNERFHVHINQVDDVFQLDLETFCRDVFDGANEWLEEYEDTDIYEENYSKFMRRYPKGLKPYIVGIPIIG